MHIVRSNCFDFNKKFQFDFSGGDLSSDGGLLLIRDFIDSIRFDQVIRELFHTTDTAASRIHTDQDNLMQRVFQIIGSYFNDDDADELRTDPVFCTVLDKKSLASQPTMSRFYNRLDESTLSQMETIHRALRKTVYRIRRPEHVLFDLDSTLLNTYGNQKGEGFNYHYQAHGYHPLLCYDGLTGDLLKAELREGTDYCSKDADEFLRPLMEEYLNEYPDIRIFLRGDSGFASPKIYSLAENHGCGYVIRLKSNSNLMRLADMVAEDLADITRKNAVVDYAVTYGEFEYQANSWDYPRRVVCKVEKPYGQICFLYTFLVTNMDSTPEELVRFYCNRGQMENYIKESKNGFDFSCMSSKAMAVNTGRLQISMLAYNLISWFKRLVLPEHFRKLQIDTLRLKLFKIAVRLTRSSRYCQFRFCSSCPYKQEFYETLANIQKLRRLELTA